MGKIKQTTQNKNYGISGGKSLYVKQGLTPPLGVVKTTKTKRHGGTTYEQYKPSRMAFPDCLHHTEEIINNQSLRPGGGTYSREKATGRVWGQSEKRNMEIAKEAQKTSASKVNEQANPDVGEGFCIARTETAPRDGKAHYPK